MRYKSRFENKSRHNIFIYSKKRENLLGGLAGKKKILTFALDFRNLWRDKAAREYCEYC